MLQFPLGQRTRQNWMSVKLYPEDCLKNHNTMLRTLCNHLAEKWLRRITFFAWIILINSLLRRKCHSKIAKCLSLPKGIGNCVCVPATHFKRQLSNHQHLVHGACAFTRRWILNVIKAGKKTTNFTSHWCYIWCCWFGGLCLKKILLSIISAI